MQAYWFEYVAAAVLRSLDELAEEAEREDGPRAGELARLVASWRALLRLHEPSSAGRCARCARSRALWRRRRPGSDASSDGALCTVWQVAIAYLVRRR